MKLSIIIPIFNLEKYLENTIASIRKSRFAFEYEIIAVNDGSSDNSENLIKKLQKCDDSIHLISIDNKGVSNARNVGMQFANGEYIAFVDGDDTVEPDFFQRAVDELDIGKYDFVQANFNIIKADSVSHIQFVEADTVLVDREVMLDFFFGNNKLIHNSVWGKVFRAELIKNESFDLKLKVAEDQKFIFNILLKAKRIKLLHDVGYNYYIRESSAMNSYDLSKRLDSISVLEYYLEKVDDEKIKNYIEISRINTLIRLYDRALISRQDTKLIFDYISAIDVKQYMNDMGKMKHKINLLLKHRWIYGKIIRLINHCR